MRASGILMPIFSLPSEFGIGCFSKEAYRFVDQLKESGQSYWQILPLGPTSYGDSPYQSFSTFAGNPYFIDLESLIEEGLLTRAECESFDFGDNQQYIDYEKIYLSRFKILKKAYDRSNFRDDKSYRKFEKKNSFWLKDYALYMAVKRHFGEISWNQWDEDIRLRNPKAIENYEKELVDEIDFFKYMQFVFSEQWRKLKDYANKNNVKIIGDIPIYVAFDSADSWSHPELFQFDAERNPKLVSGCPPDAFSLTGQLWGNPVYDWAYHKKTSYEWWIQRISYCFELYDVVRIDHFRGFDKYYAIPFGAPTAEHGKWRKGPGIELFRQLSKKIQNMNIIAEDLGFLTDSVRKLVKDSGYPGMKVLEFAFDSREESDYLPHNYNSHCVVYTGTHDNDTVQGWYRTICDEDRQLSIEYMGNEKTDLCDIHWDFIRLALSSVADLAIIPIQDYLGLGSEARINQPSTIGNNWKWRLQNGQITDELLAKIGRMTALYGRR
ncbi:MAG TPA: 4-alpha-glucanotransferase [Caproiciproducens sp.]|nr:4-alpha-glucanotransferase [Caproiciproducens sp.]